MGADRSTPLPAVFIAYAWTMADMDTMAREFCKEFEKAAAGCFTVEWDRGGAPTQSGVVDTSAIAEFDAFVILLSVPLARKIHSATVGQELEVIDECRASRRAPVAIVQLDNQEVGIIGKTFPNLQNLGPPVTAGSVQIPRFNEVVRVDGATKTCKPQPSAPMSVEAYVSQVVNFLRVGLSGHGSFQDAESRASGTNAPARTEPMTSQEVLQPLDMRAIGRCQAHVVAGGRTYRVTASLKTRGRKPASIIWSCEPQAPSEASATGDAAFICCDAEGRAVIAATGECWSLLWLNRFPAITIGENPYVAGTFSEPFSVPKAGGEVVSACPLAVRMVGQDSVAVIARCETETLGFIATARVRDGRMLVQVKSPTILDAYPADAAMFLYTMIGSGGISSVFDDTLLVKEGRVNKNVGGFGPASGYGIAALDSAKVAGVGMCVVSIEQAMTPSLQGRVQVTSLKTGTRRAVSLTEGVPNDISIVRNSGAEGSVLLFYSSGQVRSIPITDEVANA